MPLVQFVEASRTSFFYCSWKFKLWEPGAFTCESRTAKWTLMPVRLQHITSSSFETGSAVPFKGVFGRAPAPPNQLWSSSSTNLQLHRGAGLSLWSWRDVFGRDSNSRSGNTDHVVKSQFYPLYGPTCHPLFSSSSFLFSSPLSSSAHSVTRLQPGRPRPCRPSPGRSRPSRCLQPSPWSVPSSEVTKCNTNTSPRRLATHLLQQVLQSLTSRRHSGHGSANATRNNTKAKDQTTIAKASKASSEYHAMEALWGDPESTCTGWV
jgi:hypothetical protein